MVKLYLNQEYEREKLEELLKVSNPKHVIERAQLYFNNPDIKVYLSSNKNKKYAIINPNTDKLVNFGSLLYQDYTKHQNTDRQKAYLNRSSKIKGDWEKDKYSPNNLSRVLLWDAPF
jgi:hypothetical protein